jgi:hypothetical protein
VANEARTVAAWLVEEREPARRPVQGQEMRREDSKKYAVLAAWNAQRRLSHARRQEHWASHARRSRAQPKGAMGSRVLLS